MLAHHPITGAPIRVLKTETHIYKDKKTLIWLQDQDSCPRFNRWDTITVGVKDTIKWNPKHVVLVDKDEPGLKEWIKEKSKNAALCFFSKEVIEAYGVERFETDGLNNVLCLEEMNNSFDGLEYSQGSDMSLCVMKVAIKLRVARVIGSIVSSAAARFAIEIAAAAEPQQFWLIQQYFIPPVAKREREIRTCLDKNIACEYIDKIILLNEKDYSSHWNSTKVEQHIIGKRHTYADVMRFIYEKVPENCIVAFANSDIYFDKTMRQLWTLNLEDKFLSLLRYEIVDGEEPKLFGPVADSQDTWILNSSSVKSRVWDWADLDFNFGRAGCDNAINVCMLKQKFLVANPAYSIKTYHCHASGIRNYNPRDCIEKPFYLYLDPTGLHDMNPVSDLIPFTKTIDSPRIFSRKIHGTDAHVRTFCKMLSHRGAYNFEPDQDNMWDLPKEDHQTLYTFPNAFQTQSGLVSGYSSVYIGKHKSLKTAWSEEAINPMLTSVNTKTSIAIYTNDEIMLNPMSYVSLYLGQILMLREKGLTGDFWMPRENAQLNMLLQCFNWTEETIPVIPYDHEDPIQIFSNTVHMLTPNCRVVNGAYKIEHYLTMETVASLRKLLLGYAETSYDNRAVILRDDELITAEIAEKMENALLEKGYDVNIVYANRTPTFASFRDCIGSALCICGTSEKVKSELWYWLLPKKCRVIEVQNELRLRGDGVHSAGACELDFWLVLVSRGEKVEKTCEKISAFCDSVVSDDKPLVSETVVSVILPKGQTGFHAHSGDSFRELAELWAEKGLVSVKYSDNPFCWLGEIGDVLLYDRPTYQWYDSENVRAKKVLVGNPKPRDNHTSWIFWARRPMLVEELVEQGCNKADYDSREKKIVFYGKIENAVQKKNRQGSSENWSTLCDGFSMVNGEKTAYTLNHEEYLRALANSKYGLCLAGFGNKCHREIECMAMGCVPVAAAEVDMDCYANPLVEGVHYIRVRTVLEARRKLDLISKEKWSEMSLACIEWWRVNASAKGSFELTKKLGLLG